MTKEDLEEFRRKMEEALEALERKEKTKAKKRTSIWRHLVKLGEEEGLPEKERLQGAMCYSIVPPGYTEVTSTCTLCGRLIKEFDNPKFISSDVEEIERLVEEMKKLGYDVKTERVCSCCSWDETHKSSMAVPRQVDMNFSSPRADMLFYFRPEGMEAYHVAVDSFPIYYEIVLEFLRSEAAYRGRYGEWDYALEHKDTIEKMLGIKI